LATFRPRLASAIEACGITSPIQNLGELYGRACEISVGVEEDENGEYAAKNKVTKVRPVSAKPGNGSGNSAAAKNRPFDDAVPF
jgi:hypothetical protein